MATLIKNKEVVSNDPGMLLPMTRLLPISVSLACPAGKRRARNAATFSTSEKTGHLAGQHRNRGFNRKRLFSLCCYRFKFPVFTDGRAYSGARLLRERYFYKGEIRAIGDVLIDQLYLMNRIGFDALALRDDQDIELALCSFAPFSFTYQSDVLETRPLWRRRPASGVETEQKKPYPLKLPIKSP